MERVKLAQFKTSCPFPYLSLETILKYIKVEKPSGIDFIILDLLMKHPDKNEIITVEFEKMGITSVLYSFFFKQIQSLVDKDIIRTNYSFNLEDPKVYRYLKFADLYLTRKGNKLFKEGYIQTGEELKKIADFYYDPVNRKYEINKNGLIDMNSTFLKIDFSEKMEKDYEDTLDFVTGYKINFGIKQEEEILESTLKNVNYKCVKNGNNMNIVIYNDGISFEFDSKNESEYFKKHYSNSLMSECLKSNNYIFRDLKPEELKELSVKELKNYNIYSSKDIESKAKQKCELYLKRNEIKINNESIFKVEHSDILDLIDEGCKFVVVRDGSILAYVPARITFKSLTLGGNFTMQLLLERKLEGDEYQKVMNAIYGKIVSQKYSGDLARNISSIFNLSHSEEFVKKYIESQINEIKDIDDKIDMVYKMNSQIKNNLWNNVYYKVGSELLNTSINEINLGNVVNKSKKLNEIRTNLKISDKEYISKISQSISSEPDEVIVQALEDCKFDISLILTIKNVIVYYTNCILNNSPIDSETDISSKFKNIRNNLWSINDMLGVKDYEEYSVNEEYNVKDFTKYFSTLTQTMDDVKKYELYAKDNYNSIKKYIDIYRPIYDYIKIEEEGSSKPDKITKDYINSYINQGKYKNAICDMMVKLQYVLRNQYKKKKIDNVNDLLKEAIKDKHIDDKDYEVLNKLRVIRNNFQHPSSKDVKFDSYDVKKFSEVVFRVCKNLN